MFTEWVVLLHFHCLKALCYLCLSCMSVSEHCIIRTSANILVRIAQIWVRCALCCVFFPPQTTNPTPNQNTQKNHKQYLPSKTNFDDVCLFLLCATWVRKLLVAWVTVIPVNVFWHNVSLIGSPLKSIAHVSPEWFAPRTVRREEEEWGKSDISEDWDSGEKTKQNILITLRKNRRESPQMSERN